MKKTLLTIAGATVIALGLGACAYDPYYNTGNTRTSVAVGHGYGHGYGGSSFSTSFFWSTGDPRWGYDPYARSYYDHHRRAYYDPYLYGYYPVGYRPTILVGVPHPSGYRQGWCPPPRRVNNVTVVNYRNRESAYRRTNHRWAQNVSYDTRHRTSGTRTHNRDDGRSRRDSANWGGRGSSRGATNATTPGTRSHWDGRRRGGDPNIRGRDNNRNPDWNRGSRTQNRSQATPQPRTNLQPRTTPRPRPSAGSAPASSRQSTGRPVGDRRGSPPQGAAPRGQRGISDGAASRAARQAQRPVAPAPGGRRHSGSPPRGGGFQPSPTPAAPPPQSGGARRQGGGGGTAAPSRGGRGGRGVDSRGGGRR